MDKQHLLDNQNGLVQQFCYDAFENPPSLMAAELHYQANRVGKVNLKETLSFCPCCQNIVNKEPLSVCFKDEELLSFGVGYPLYYKIAKYYIAIMILIFFVSGSAIYFLMTLSCRVQERCYHLFGIPIINLSIAEKTNLGKTQLANMMTSIAIFMVVVYLKTVINNDIIVLTQQKRCPSVYTIMLQNVPDSTNQELSEWISQVFGEKPIQINWAYDIDQLKKTYKLKQKLMIQYNTLNIRLQKSALREERDADSILNEIKQEKTQHQLKMKIEGIKSKIQSCNSTLNYYNTIDHQCKKIGTVFLTFERVKVVNRIIQEYQCSFINTVMKNVFRFIKKSRLQYKDNMIIVSKAPAPKEVIWNNLGFSYIKSIIFELSFIFCMLFMLFGALKLILYLMNEALYFKILSTQSDGQANFIVKAIFMSIIILIVNCVMRLVIEAFTYEKKYQSYTKYQASFCLYYSIFYIINACCLVYIVHGQIQGDTTELLFADIHLIMISNAFSEPLFKLFDPIMWFRIFRRFYVSRLKAEENPYTQEYMNKLWEGHQIQNADNYQYITRVLFVTTWFASVAPLGVFISLVGIILDYWISKVMLSKVYKIPENISEDIVRPTLMGLQLLPLVYICGVLQFSYKVTPNTDFLALVNQFFNYGITTAILLFSIVGYVIFCKRKSLPRISRSYSQSKLSFLYTYETTNPVTRLKGNINYLYDVLKQNQHNNEQNKVLTDLLSLSRSSIDKFNQKHNEIYKIKLNFYHKMSQQDRNIELEEIQSYKHPQQE